MICLVPRVPVCESTACVAALIQKVEMCLLTCHKIGGYYQFRECRVLFEGMMFAGLLTIAAIRGLLVEL